MKTSFTHALERQNKQILNLRVIMTSFKMQFRRSSQMNRRFIDIGETSPYARAAEGDRGSPHRGANGSICV